MTRIGAFVLASLAAATLVTTSAQNRTPPRIPGIDTAGMDLSVRPQDDFFRYVNGTWVDSVSVKSQIWHRWASHRTSENSRTCVRRP